MIDFGEVFISSMLETQFLTNHYYSDSLFKDTDGL